jgi:Bacterial Ig domain
LTNTARRLGAVLRRSREASPRAVLTWPLPCAAIDRPVDLFAVASDGTRSVQRVEFLIDGQQLASVAAAPYRASFDPTGWPPGSAVIEVRAITGRGAVATFHSIMHLNGDGGPCQPWG